MTSTERGLECVCCLFHTHEAVVGPNVSETLPALLISPPNLLLFSPPSPLPPYSGLTPAETPTTGLPFNPASILHVSFLLLVRQCSTARPRIVNRILGKRRAKLKASPDFRVHCRGGARRPAKAARDTVSKTIAKKPQNKILQVHVCYNATVT